MPGMTKRLGRTNRVEFRLPPDLDAEVRAECARLGWNITEWGERACRSLLSELAAVPSEAEPSAASNFDRLQGASAGADPRPGPARIAPVRKVKASTADLNSVESGAAPSTKAGEGEDARVSPARLAAPRRAQLGNVGPKPLSATKPRPKSTKKVKG